jgi:hypothetical protein
MNVNSARRGDGIVRIQDGAFVGDGTACIINLGFIPSFFQLINLTDATVYEKTRGMPAASSHQGCDGRHDHGRRHQPDHCSTATAR